MKPPPHHAARIRPRFLARSREDQKARRRAHRPRRRSGNHSPGAGKRRTSCQAGTIFRRRGGTFAARICSPSLRTSKRPTRISAQHILRLRADSFLALGHRDQASAFDSEAEQILVDYYVGLTDPRPRCPLCHPGYRLCPRIPAGEPSRPERRETSPYPGPGPEARRRLQAGSSSSSEITARFSGPCPRPCG